MLVRSLHSPFEKIGVGVHSGRPAKVSVRPGPPGFRFHRDGVVVPALVDFVIDTSMSTSLGRDGVRIGMVEHLLSALWGLGVEGADIQVEGSELPILDGSAAPWVDRLLDHSTAREVTGPARSLVVTLSAREGLDALGPRTVSFDLENGDYAAEIGWARTFVHAGDVERLLADGRGAGATAENTLVVGDPGGPPVVRGPSEPTRHKLLDALGDLALLGRPHRGTIRLVDSGHTSHVDLVRGLASQRS